MACIYISSKPGVANLALIDPQGISEAFQEVYDR